MQKMTCSAVQIDQIPLHFESRHATLFMQAPAATAGDGTRREPRLVPRCHHHRRAPPSAVGAAAAASHQLAEARLENQTAKKKKKPEHRVEKLHSRVKVIYPKYSKHDIILWQTQLIV